MGIGLSIARTIVEAPNGQIFARARPVAARSFVSICRSHAGKTDLLAAIRSAIALWDNSAIRLWHSYTVRVCLTRLTPPPAMSVSELKQIISPFVIVCGVLAAVIMVL